LHGKEQHFRPASREAIKNHTVVQSQQQVDDPKGDSQEEFQRRQSFSLTNDSGKGDNVSDDDQEHKEQPALSV
jgi:hypothetical protein